MLLFVTSKSTIAATAALTILGWVASAGLAVADPAPAPPPPAPAPPPGAAPAPGHGPAPAPAKTTIDKDGVYNVGTDIVPGVYTSAGPVGNGVCYWKRLGDDAKQPLDNAMSKKPQIVRIEPTDKTFKTDGCQAWQKNDAAVPDPGKSPEQAGLPLGILNSLIGGGGAPAPSPPPAPAPAPAPPK
jgi:hypothetical protein